MIKAKVIKPFSLYYVEGKELYLDEDKFNKLKEQGLVEEADDITLKIEPVPVDGKKIYKAVVKNSKIEKATNDKTRILSD